MFADIPNLRHLNIALQIRKGNGFSGASKVVNLSPSSITQAMRGLEEQLGATLFDRAPSGAFINELGGRYLARIETAFEALSDAEAVLGGNTGQINVRARMTASQLKSMIAVCKSGSYSLAARRMGLSQPSVYKAARGLETLFGKRLFNPSPSGVEPTARAREFARHASIALSEIERAQEEIMEYQGLMAGRLAIGTLPLIRTQILPDTLTELLDEYPDARVQIFDGVYADMLDALRHGDIDILLGAIRSPAPVDDVEQHPLLDDEQGVLVRAGHPLVGQNQIDLDTLMQLDWIVPHLGTPSRTYFETMIKDHKRSDDIRRIECGSLIAVRGLLRNSDRAALMSPTQARNEIDRGDLAALNVRLEGSSRTIGYTTRRNWHPTRLQSEFLKLLCSNSDAL